MLAQEFVHLHRGVEGKATVVCPDVHRIRVDLVPKIKKRDKSEKHKITGRTEEGMGIDFIIHTSLAFEWVLIQGPN